MMKMMKMNAVAKEEAKATAAEAAEAKRAEEARANAEARRMAEEAARKAAFEAAEARKADFEAEKARKAFEAVKVIMRHGFALRSLQIIIRARILVLNFLHSRTCSTIIHLIQIRMGLFGPLQDVGNYFLRTKLFFKDYFVCLQKCVFF